MLHAFSRWLNHVPIALLAAGCGGGSTVTTPSRTAEPPRPPARQEGSPLAALSSEEDRSALPSRLRLRQAIQTAQAARPCGLYVNEDSIWPGIDFGDGHQVWILLDLEAGRRPEAVRAWVPMEEPNELAVRTDRGFFVFEREGADRLRGLDEWTDGGTWQRTARANATCAPVAASPEERNDFSHELCELDGFLLQERGRVDDALTLFERCCRGGAGASCDRAGQLLELVRRDVQGAEQRYRIACDAGHARGCRDLAVLCRRTQREDEAQPLLRRACDLGSTEACSDLADSPSGL